jgi:DNA-binding ferritin-like protein
MFNMSASMGPKFAETADEMTERVRRLGPSPLRDNQHPEKMEATLTDNDEGETK